jgi:hypothetical protein
MKTVVQLDRQGYFMGTTIADQSPLEPGVYLMPAGTIDVALPVIPDNHCARWVHNRWTFELLPEIVAAENQIARDDEIDSLKRQVARLEQQVVILQSQLSKISELKDQIENLSEELDARI